MASSSRQRLLEGEVFRSKAFVVTREASGRLVRLARTEVPLDEAALREVMAFFDRFFPPLMRPEFVFLLDSRLAPMVMDREMEKRVNEVGARLVLGFARTAVLVETATGKLQAARMTREKGRAPVFVDEVEALSYLLSDLGFD